MSMLKPMILRVGWSSWELKIDTKRLRQTSKKEKRNETRRSSQKEANETKTRFNNQVFNIKLRCAWAKKRWTVRMAECAGPWGG